MKKGVLILVLLATSLTCFCQKKQYWVDSIIRTFNFQKNELFASMQLEDTSGRLINTSSFIGKTIYVDFWFTTCAPCLKEIPYSKNLQKYFVNDTNVIFLSICIENIERKTAWKQIIKEKQLGGIHLFYARNRPQKINLLRKYEIAFPTYLLLNKEMRVIGYNAPRPSETGWVQWAILKAEEGKCLSESFSDVLNQSKNYTHFIDSFK